MSDNASLREELLCDVCAGTGSVPSGRTCICGGSGFIGDAFRNLRRDFFDQLQQLATTREIARELAEALLVIARMLTRFPAQGVLIRNGDWPDSVQPQCAIRKASAAYRIADLALAKARAAGILNAKEQK